MRIVIAGGGQVGSSLARALAASHEVFVIDHDPEVADVFQAMDVEFLVGSGTSEEVLGRAGIAQCDFFVAATGLDEVNIVGCALASRLGRAETVCLVSRPEFLGAAGTGGRLGAFGISRVVWPEAQLAADIERIVTAPGAIDAEVFAGGIVRLLEYRLAAGSPLTATTLGGLRLPRGSLIVAVKRAGRIFVPRGSTRLQAADKVIVMGTPEAMHAVEALLNPGRAGSRLLVTIIGGGDVGFQLAQRLEQTPSIDLRVLERDADRGTMLAGRLSRTLVLNGDGTDLEFLESENVGRSDVLVSVIDNDERNLLASLLGRQLGVPKVITRVGRPANLRLFERVGIDVAISARGAAVASILHHITGGATSLLAIVEHGEARVFELVVSPSFEPRELKDMGAAEDAIVAAILRGNRAIVPRGDDRIEPGDRIVVFCTQDAADRVCTFFTGAAS
ncbi:MAG: Trk system potassium transporter TrkA [Acidobacteria bacterium]|nr:Trk system potassium transporter TrkA [Acidobacteriota bacterium]HQZ38247.1 Trk system potassium transporter TrkA [Vicinamibacterales bacterium]